MRILKKNTKDIPINIREAEKEVIKKFRVFDDWIDKYTYIIKLGRNLPSMNLEYKIDENIIKGCQLKTWFYSDYKDGRVFYNIDSMSAIIKGISALLIKVLSGQKPEDIKNADMNFIDKIGLRGDFSPIRENSLWKLINQIKSDAALYEKNKIKI